MSYLDDEEYKEGDVNEEEDLDVEPEIDDGLGDPLLADDLLVDDDTADADDELSDEFGTGDDTI